MYKSLGVHSLAERLNTLNENSIKYNDFQWKPWGRGITSTFWMRYSQEHSKKVTYSKIEMSYVMNTFPPEFDSEMHKYAL